MTSHALSTVIERRDVERYKAGERDDGDDNDKGPTTIMSSKQRNLMRLCGSIQEYDWGKTGSASLAARLAANALGPDFKVKEDKSYAEVRVTFNTSYHADS